MGASVFDWIFVKKLKLKRPKETSKLKPTKFGRSDQYLNVFRY